MFISKLNYIKVFTDLRYLRTKITLGMRNFDTRLSPGNSTINNHQVNVTWISSHTAVYERNPNKKIIIVTDIKFPSFDCSVYDGFLWLSRIGSFMFKLGDSFNRTQTFV